MHNRQLDDRHMERFEDEVNLLAEERGISFSAALALKNGEASPPAKKRTAKKRGISRADLEEIREGIRELQEQTIGRIEREIDERLDEMALDGTINRIARGRGLDVGEAMVQLEAELREPYAKIQREYEEKRLKRAEQAVPDEATLDRKAQAYADKHGVPYVVALEAILPGSTGPVELAASRTPKVDGAEAALNRRAEDYARRKGVSFETALTAVLEEGR